MFMGLPLDLEYSCASEGLLTIHYQPRFATSGFFLLLWSGFRICDFKEGIDLGVSGSSFTPKDLAHPPLFVRLKSGGWALTITKFPGRTDRNAGAVWLSAGDGAEVAWSTLITTLLVRMFYPPVSRLTSEPSEEQQI